MHGPVEVAGEVAGPGPFHLDHPRAQVGELAGGERRGHRLLQRDDRDALQHGPAGHGATEFRLTSWRAITLRWISLVPSPTIISGASRK